MEELLSRFCKNVPAKISAIMDFASNISFLLPDDYYKFLLYSNGGQGFIGRSCYSIFWPLEKLLEYNLSYEVPKFAPSLFLIGSDGGGECYAFDVTAFPSLIFSVPFIDMDPALARHVNRSFMGFLRELYVS